MTRQRDDFGEELTDFVRRVGELRTARALPPDERLTVLDATLFELQYVVDELWPRYERLVRAGAADGGSPSASAVSDRQERQLLKSLFQRLPLAVALVDRDTVVRRMNFAATGLTGVRAGYAAGRPLASLLTPGDRAAFRSQTAAVGRGEGDRSLRVRLQQRPDEPLLATLTALRPPDEPRPAVLVVFQSAAAGSGAAPPAADGRSPRTPPDLAGATRHAELSDLVDTMASALLGTAPGDRAAVLRVAAGVLHGRFADWVVADSVGDGSVRRELVLGPAQDRLPDHGAGLVHEVAGQDPGGCPLVLEAAHGGSGSLQVRPEDAGSFGRDASGVPVLTRADVTSLLCVPLVARVPSGGGTTSPGPVRAVLTLFRTGNRPAFSMAEGQAMDVMARHAALAAVRPAPPGGACP
jgi:PAS domain-containing protein